MSNFTLVTGLWDLGREKLTDFGRSFDHYLENFGRLLSLDFPMVVYVPKELNRFVIMNRNMANTRIVNKELPDFQTWFPWYTEVQEIRHVLRWREQASWLENSPQCKLSYYNPIVMSKFFMLNDSAVANTFNTEYFYWIDAGLTNTVDIGQLRNMENLPGYMEDKKFLFLSYPYSSESEVHGFESKKFDKLCGEKSTYVCRGGFFGGEKETINKLNGEYYGIATECFHERCMGTEENFHTILSHRSKDVYRFELDDSGLVYKFFDYIGNKKFETTPATKNFNLIPYDKRKDPDDLKTSLYILTFNSPDQFDKVAPTWIDNGFDKCRRILVNNSTDESTYTAYQELCEKYGFEHIKKEGNVGICGGRQFVAEHFNESDSEYYVFVEDDMFLNPPNQEVDKFGYPRYTDNLYRKSLSVIHKNRYDFLKLTYCEFYGDNSVSWAWYNVPQPIREEYWPEKPNLPEQGLDPDAPKVEIKARNRYKDLYYLEGNFHYCNWPVWISREGNYKIFLETKWTRPYEQTWMSYVFQQQVKGKIRSAVLEASPITHDRFEFYTDTRIES